VFRDSHGVVHTVSSADPLLDLPGDTAGALAAALLQPAERDLEAALDRCEAVRELLERWQDAFFAALPDDIDLAEEARWAAEAGMSLAEVEAGYDDDGDDDGEDDEPDDDDGLVEVDLGPLGDDHPDLPDLGLDAVLDPVLDEPVDVPEELVQLLERELLLLPLRVRLEALVAAAALVGTWSDLLSDHEKLLGHLVLGHGEPTAAADHGALAARHASLHAAAGPGHPDAAR
jgi:hypothetical protein